VALNGDYHFRVGRELKDLKIPDAGTVVRHLLKAGARYDLSLAAALGDGGHIKLWHTATTSEPALDTIVHGGVVHSLAFSSDGLRLVTSDSDKILRVWDVGTHLPLTDWIPSPEPIWDLNKYFRLFAFLLPVVLITTA